MSFEDMHEERLDLFGVGSGDPGDGLSFDRAFHAGHVIRCALALWVRQPGVMFAGVVALWGADFVAALVSWGLMLAMRMLSIRVMSPDVTPIAITLAVWFVSALLLRFFREMIEAGVVTTMAQVCWEGDWSLGALFFAFGPTVRRVLVQVVGAAVLALPWGILAAVSVGVGWATLWPIIESGDYFDVAMWVDFGLAAAVVAVVGGLIMAVLWSVVWVVLQPAIVAATVGMSPFAAVAYSARQMRTFWAPVLGLNALYGVVVLPLAVLSGPSGSGCTGFFVILVFGVPLALVQASWLAGTTMAWMRHARSDESWPIGGVGRAMIDDSPGA